MPLQCMSSAPIGQASTVWVGIPALGGAIVGIAATFAIVAQAVIRTHPLAIATLVAVLPHILGGKIPPGPPICPAPVAVVATQVLDPIRDPTPVRTLVVVPGYWVLPTIAVVIAQPRTIASACVHIIWGRLRGRHRCRLWRRRCLVDVCGIRTAGVTEG